MPGRIGRNLSGVFVTDGDPDNVNDAAALSTNVGAQYDLSGQLGALWQTADGLKEYIYARFSSTSTGKTPAADQLCFWVTSSSTHLSGLNLNSWVVDNQTSANTGTSVKNVAGVLRVAATRGNYVWLLRKSAHAVPVVSTSTIGNLGESVVASTASGEAVQVSSTSTVAPAGGISATPWFIGMPYIGYLASTSTAPAFVGSTATAGIGVNLPVLLHIV